jgi:ribosomal-protein-alanine N-acetyltransferase
VITGQDAQPLEILTERFVLRELQPSDAGEHYLRWLDNDDARRYIVAAARKHSLQDLQLYIAVRNARDDVLFLGIFLREGGQHIGNLKYEPVDRREGYAIMGILVGEPEWRGRAVAREAIAASALWLKANCGISEILLGVEEENRAAIQSYTTLGFLQCDTPWISAAPGVIRMRWFP